MPIAPEPSERLSTVDDWNKEEPATALEALARVHDAAAAALQEFEEGHLQDAESNFRRGAVRWLQYAFSLGGDGPAVTRIREHLERAEREWEELRLDVARLFVNRARISARQAFEVEDRS